MSAAFWKGGVANVLGPTEFNQVTWQGSIPWNKLRCLTVSCYYSRSTCLCLRYGHEDRVWFHFYIYINSIWATSHSSPIAIVGLRHCTAALIVSTFCSCKAVWRPDVKNSFRVLCEKMIAWRHRSYWNASYPPRHSLDTSVYSDWNSAPSSFVKMIFWHEKIRQHNNQSGHEYPFAIQDDTDIQQD